MALFIFAKRDGKKKPRREKKPLPPRKTEFLFCPKTVRTTEGKTTTTKLTSGFRPQLNPVYGWTRSKSNGKEFPFLACEWGCGVKVFVLVGEHEDGGPIVHQLGCVFGFHNDKYLDSIILELEPELSKTQLHIITRSEAERNGNNCLELETVANNVEYWGPSCGAGGGGGVPTSAAFGDL